MKGYTIQHSIDLLEKQIETGGSGGSTTAESVSYDNTSSGLTADDVQEAIDELKSDIPTIAQYGDNYSDNEIVIGTWTDGRPVYRKVIKVASATFSGVTISVTTGLSGIDTVISAHGVLTIDSNSRRVTLPLFRSVLAECIGLQTYVDSAGAVTCDILSGIGGQASLYTAVSNIAIVLDYIKPVVQNNTRSKKKKEEN